MRIREIYFRDFRCFRGEHRISFVDPVTDQVRPVTLLGGSNGTGKTTILEAIEALIELFVYPREATFDYRQNTGLVCIALELSSADILKDNNGVPLFNNGLTEIVHIALGQPELLPDSWREMWPNLYGYFSEQKQKKPHFYFDTYGDGQALQEKLSLAADNMREEGSNLYGGLVYFPHNRQLTEVGRGPIEPSSERLRWIFHFTSPENWPGSLEQLWVWQNYLDLEQGTQDRQHLEPFVKSVETILGKNRRIQIKEGRVTVPAGWGDNGEAPRVRLDQLPSGEQQVLLLFGELARRRRPGCIIAIDEIENSLHPTLQRLVMWNLRRIAREWDAQVIVTTHSAEVINTVRGGAFINLD